MTAADQLAIFLASGQTAYRPGEQLSVSVLWALAEAPALLEVRLFWQTRGKGTEDIVIVEQQEIAAPGIAGERSITFVLPAEPWSFSGKLISLGWGIEVVATPGEQNARCDFVLSPNGQEILLPEISDAARA